MPKPIAVRRSEKVAHSTNAHDSCECKVQFVDAKCCEFVRALIELSPWMKWIAWFYFFSVFHGTELWFVMVDFLKIIDV